jgi:dolichol-phosphate mannosyltransferase
LRAVRFYAVGAIGIAVQLGALWLLHDRLRLGLTLATALAVELAVLNNFVWHERWTWRDRPAPWPQRLARVARFHLTNGAISIAGNLAITKALHDGLGVHYLLASAMSIAVCAVANYWASEYLVFKTTSLE